MYNVENIVRTIEEERRMYKDLFEAKFITKGYYEEKIMYALSEIQVIKKHLYDELTQKEVTEILDNLHK